MRIDEWKCTQRARPAMDVTYEELKRVAESRHSFTSAARELRCVVKGLPLVVQEKYPDLFPIFQANGKLRKGGRNKNRLTSGEKHEQ